MEVQRHVDQTLGERHVKCNHDLSLRAGAGVGIVTFTNPVHCSAHLSAILLPIFPAKMKLRYSIYLLHSEEEECHMG